MMIMTFDEEGKPFQVESMDNSWSSMYVHVFAFVLGKEHRSLSNMSRYWRYVRRVDLIRYSCAWNRDNR